MMTTRVHRTSTRRRAKLGVISGLMLVTVFAGGASAADSNLPGGTAISVTIDAPPDGTLVADPPGGFTLTGTASVGEGLPVKDTTLVFTMDRSGSMGLSAGVDCTGDGSADTRMVCQKEGVATVLQAAADPLSTVDLVGLASFSDGGTAHDVNLGAGGTQLLVSPTLDSDGDGVADIEEVARGVSPGGATSYGAGLAKTVDILNDAANSNSHNSVVFLSDGENNTAPDISAVAIPAATNIQAFALGTGVSCSSDPVGFGSLDETAARSTAGTGGCEQVTDLSRLAAVIMESRGSTLDAVEISVGGSAFQPVGSTSVALPQDGPVSLTYEHAVSGLTPGDYDIRVRATGTDAGGTDSAIDRIDVTVADIALTPSAETNELGTPGQDHTVTATVAAGPDGGVPAVSVDFDVLSGPNAGAGGSGVTDSSGEVAFTYPATQGLAGLGTDTIRACFTDDLGNELCSQATKEWVDTTPPDPGCTPADNPAGNEPQAGNRSPGQNEDGYYQLTALDAVDPDPEIFLVDTGSGTVFGPFTHGTTVKYTQSPGATPTQKQIGGPGSQVQWHIKGTGDAAVFAVDASGNESAQVRCLVPPQPQ